MTIAQKRQITRQRRFLYAAVLGLWSMGSLLSAGVALGADTKPIVNEKFSDLGPAIAELRRETGRDRRLIIAANMLLTNSENPQFWPLYDEYRVERNKVGDRKVRLITDFIAERDSMSEDAAETLTKEYFSIEKDIIAVKEKYVAKMSRVLSARTVARFFQIDQKLDAAVDLALAANIPLFQ
jgi:hypothetical protein